MENDYPTAALEVLVVDGLSDDGTLDIVRDYCSRYSYVRILENPKRIAPSALNIGIRAARGDIIIRMDAHSKYPPHFISKCVNCLSRIDADVVGGPVITMAGTDTLIARSIALMTAHPFGVGNSRFRTSTEEGYVDTVPFGAYRRSVFDKIGLFDERLVRNQDNEMSSRIIEKGGKIYLTPELAAEYYNQATLGGLIKQALRTGMWNVWTVKLNPAAFRFRHFIPLAFVIAVLSLSSLSVIWPPAWPAFLAMLSLYGIAAAGSSLSIASKAGLQYLPVMPAMFFIYHSFYGLGSIAGVARIFRKNWTA